MQKDDFRMYDACTIQVCRRIPNDNVDALWVVFSEDGVSFQNSHGTKPSLGSPLAATVAVEFPDLERPTGSNVTVGSIRPDEIGSDYLTDPVTIHVENERNRAMDENGDTGKGGSKYEAVYNTQAIIELTERFA